MAANQTWAEKPMFDKTALDRQIPFGESSIRQEVIAQYLLLTRPIVDYIAKASLAQQYREIERLSHQIRSSTAMLGATRLACLLQEIERTIQNNLLEAAEELLQLLPDLAAESFALLEHQLTTTK